MYTNSLDVATGEKLCCCNIEPVWKINPQKESVAIIKGKGVVKNTLALEQ